MPHSLIEILILVIVVGAILYILSILPIDATLKTIGRVVILVIAAIYAITMLAPLLHAQPRSDNAMEDFFRSLEGRQTNPDLICTVSRRLSRDGDLVRLNMDCRSVEYAHRR
jgi:hypothetical protein